MGHVVMENRHGLAVAGRLRKATGTAERRMMAPMLVCSSSGSPRSADGVSLPDLQKAVRTILDGCDAGGLLAEGFFGVSPNTKPDAYDPDAARKLLAEAGYPNGFALTIHGPNDRYINDARFCRRSRRCCLAIGLPIPHVWVRIILPQAMRTGV
jgi:hypothetical protein